MAREPSQEYLREIFNYDVELGRLRWKKLNPKCYRAKVGDLAGGLSHKSDSKIFYQVSIDGKSYYNSRIVWIYHNGFIPSTSRINHQDGNTLNDKIGNLRLLTLSHINFIRSKNNNNNNTSGHPGVWFDKRLNKWRTYIKIDNVQIYLGTYDLKEDAIKARKQAEIKYHGEFISNV
jgi:hypothetical protein